MKLLIPVAAGLEASVKRQLKKMGYVDCPATGGRIALEGGWEDVARLNVFLRSGERVLIVLGEFPAPTFDALFDGVRALSFEEFLSPRSKILLDGKCVRSELMAIKAVGGVTKKAIVDRLREKLGVRTLDEKGERATVGVSLVENVATITLDTSGAGLHKRGYRTLAYDAPLKETTAAAMVESSFFRAGKPFADLFCGSGTLPVEAALYARNEAPGKNRAFDFTAFHCCSRNVLARAREEAEDTRFRGEIPPLFGGDISPRAIEIARYHAKRAGVEKDIRFSCADMRTFASEEKYGIIISNPPYGERLEAESDLFPLYRDFSRTFRRLPDWSCTFLTSYAGAERAFGRADKRRKLYNANIECCLYSYFGKPPRNKSENFVNL